MKVNIDLNSFSDSISTENLYQLIFVSNSKIQISSFDSQSKKILSLKEYSLEKGLKNLSVSDLKENIPEVKEKYQKKILSFSSPKITLVPKEFMKDDISNEFYKLNFNKESGEDIRKDYLSELNSFLIYSTDFNYSKIKLAFNPDDSFNSATAFFKGIFKINKLKDTKSTFIEIDDNFIKLVFFEFDKLKIMNTYNYKSKEDILYHILNVSEQFDIDSDKDNYYFCGNIDKNTELYKLLFNYIRYPILLHRIDTLNYDKCFDKTPSHRYFNIFSTALCE